MPPKYTRTFADVYLAELDYVKKRRDEMGLISKAVETELENVRQAIKTQRDKSVKDRQHEVKKNVFRRFKSWLYKLFSGESEDAPSLNIKASTQAGLVGLALSGGGVRSATFNLGLLQSLAKNKILQYCDYLSTVSGGGYIGSCLSALLANAPEASTKPENFPLSNQPDGKLEERAEVNYLRETKNYLGAGGIFSQDTWHMIGTTVSGFVLMSTMPLAFILLIVLIGLFLDDLAVRNIMIVVAVAFAIWIVAIRFFRLVWPLGSTSYKSRIRHGKRIANRTAIVNFLVIAILLIQFVSYLWFFFEVNSIFILYILAASLLVVIVGPFIHYNDKFLQKFLRIIMSVALLVLFLIPSVWLLIYLDEVVNWFFKENTLFTVIGIIAMVLLIISLFVNLNRNSLHYFYRDRLSNTYLFKRNDEQTKIEPDDSIKMKDLHQHHNGPYHLINATLNVPHSKNREIKGRGADFFIFSKYYCGAESTGYRNTENYNDGKTELATTMALSGAAVSPEMGTQTNPIKSVLMTLLNIRLNLWMPNPNRKLSPQIILWPFYLYKELFHKSMENDALLNLSDGGHHENLGIYPLLKRRCHLIIASDAGADPKFKMEDLANLQRKARIDLGINIDMDMTLLRPNQDKNSKAYYVKGTIYYPDNERGTLFYIKTTMKGDEPEDLLAYRRKNARFPDETTADQFFNEDQFESYRKLGELVGENLCSTSDIHEQI